MPTGCNDLKQLGYLKSGFYTVKSPANNKLRTVYCDFSNRFQGIICDPVHL